MPLASGSRLGPYEIVERVGAGGMGEVYRARDTRLMRTVAIKILPSELAHDAKLRLRLEREGRSISALNHPNICTLHDVGSENGIDYLVLEFCEGQTLAARLERGPLPVEQVLSHGIAIADALSKAHRAGIFHRDLKPSNIMLTKSGVKLLDFGLAAESPGDDARAPGDDTPLRETITAAGTLVGTIFYLPPEAIAGKRVDARGDIFAFGCVLYEMLTARRAFAGVSRASVIASILEREPPPLHELQPRTPPALEHLIARCLRKEPDARWESAHDVAEQLRWIASEGAAAPPQRKRGRGALVAAMLALALIAALASWKAFRRSDEPGTVGFSVPVPEIDDAGQAPAFFGSGMRTNDVAISADGRRIAFAVTHHSTCIYVRSVDALDSTRLPAAEYGANPFFSPDGRWIGFFRLGKLLKTPVAGGAAQTITANLGGLAEIRGATWGTDGTVYYSPNPDGGLWAVPENGGRERQLTEPDLAAGENGHTWPHMLPDGKHILFTIRTEQITSFDDAKIAVLDLETLKWRVVLEGGAYAQYVSTGHLLFGRAGALYAVPFDVDTMSVTGTPRKAIDGVGTDPSTGAAQYAVNSRGDLAYLGGGVAEARTDFLALDRTGHARTIATLRLRARRFRVSPDETRIAMEVATANGDIWVHDLRSGSTTRITTEPGTENFPIWTPDGTRIVYQSTRPAGLRVRRVDGTGDVEELARGLGLHAWSCSPDGEFVGYHDWNPATQDDLWLVSLAAPHTPRLLLRTPAIDADPDFSPDGRWIAYWSDDGNGVPQIYVRSIAPGSGRLQISVDGGYTAQWSNDGRELFFQMERNVFSAAIAVDGELRSAKPRLLFTLPIAPLDLDVTRTGFVTTALPAGPRSVNVILGWQRKLET